MHDDHLQRPPSARCFLTGAIYHVGDLVTREGTDVHRVIRVLAEDSIEVECVTPPSTGWCSAGDKEINLPRRFAHI